MFRLFRRKYDFFPPFDWRDFLVLIGGLAVFVGLAASTIDKFSIWFDEAFGAYLIRFDFLSVAHYTANDVHPPLYYWLLKIWTTLFGNTELGLRSMSLFFGAITVIFAFLLALRLFGRRTAYVSLLFLIISPMFIRYSQEARMYTLLTAIIVAATYVLVYASHSKKRWPWILYGVLVAAGMLTQYLAALAWVAHWVWRFITVRVKGEKPKATMRRFFSKDWMVAHAVAFVLFLPWLPFLVKQFFVVQGYGFWIKPVTSVTIPNFLTDVIFFSDASGVMSWLALGFTLFLCLFIYLAYRKLRELKDDDKKNYLLLVCLVIVPIILLFVMSMPPLRPAFVDRYLMEVVVFLSLFIAASLTYGAKVLGVKTQLVVVCVVAGMMVVGIANQMVIGNLNRFNNQSNDTRQLLEKIRAQGDPAGTPIIADTPWIFYEAVVYDKPDSPVYFVNEITQYKYGSLTALAENDDHKIKDLDAFDAQHKIIWEIGNLKDTAPHSLRNSWRADKTITINNDATGEPLYSATRFIVE